MTATMTAMVVVGAEVEMTVTIVRGFATLDACVVILRMLQTGAILRPRLLPPLPVLLSLHPVRPYPGMHHRPIQVVQSRNATAASPLPNGR